MKDFETLLAESVTVHGHLCAGQVIGVRMSMLAMQRIGIDEPRGADRKKLYVLVEIDRCATDAIQAVTGCSLGKRSMYFHDFGVMAATFVNLETGRAVRVTAREEARDLVGNYCLQGGDKYSRQLEAYKVMAEDELFLVQDVRVDIPAVNLPGRPQKRIQCDTCHDWVQDGREIERDGELLCRSCAFGRYYRVVETTE